MAAKGQGMAGGDRSPILEGHFEGRGLRVAIVLARFNALVGERLLDGARDALLRHGVLASDVTVVKVPGAFELPGVARRVVARGTFDAVICLGAVIRGDTPHFEHVCQAAARGIAELALAGPVPVIFGVLTTDTLEQALDRAGGKAGNKGSEAAAGAIEMARLVARLDAKD